MCKEQKMSKFIEKCKQKGMSLKQIETAFKNKFGEPIPQWMIFLHDLDIVSSSQVTEKSYSKTTNYVLEEKYKDELLELNSPREVQKFALEKGEDPRALIDLWDTYQLQKIEQQREKMKQLQIKKILAEPAEAEEKVIELYKIGVLPSHICNMLNLSKNKVYDKLRKYKSSRG